MFSRSQVALTCLLLLPSLFEAASLNRDTNATSEKPDSSGFRDGSLLLASRHGRSSSGARSGVAASSASAAAARQALRAARLQEIEALNARRPPAPWTAVANEFTDMDDAERRARLGYVRSAQARQALQRRPGFMALRKSTSEESGGLDVAAAVDYRASLLSSNFTVNQGDCGSCWAVASAGALEMHLERASKGKDVLSLAYQDLVDCMPNPERCGGSGGCDGATAELAFDYVSKKGLRVLSGDAHKPFCNMHSRHSITADGYKRLPTNLAQPLLEALDRHGPVVVSVDAEKWFNYGFGIFDDCKVDAIVDHAVVAIGYGFDVSRKMKYWLIRNSWGKHWGEAGTIRLLRHDDDDDSFCGVDRSPQEGVFCAGGPSEVPVCGMCGVLSDSSYPLNVRRKAEKSRAELMHKP
eukprot:TRINITY_DN7793_c0_g7_i1.p1 TRINITY_DN7793_c0_g7~~TRINITY_DN7793_c0_g7_i1.p1  ORF type:complete len:411 (+),score=101.98 TRINITY_DN7793_c0_g7_i1:234-1466(+)